MELDRRACDRARRSRVARFDGRFFIGVTSTGIYCRPICPARSPKDENIRYFPTATAAEGAGFRPCLRCQPEASPGQKIFAEPECYRIRLAYRPPYDWDAVLAFLAARATPGVEAVNASTYRRTITVDGQHGSIAVSLSASVPSLDLDVRLRDPRSLLLIVERVRRLFDLGADPAVIAEHLGDDPLLRGPLRMHPGVRRPGAWDGFELSVRAILGQQISVRGATTMAGRVAAMFGTPADLGEPWDRLFPTPAQLAEAAIERAGVISARARAIRALARGVMDGSIVFSPGTGSAVLTAIPGIGDWTAQYIAMRAGGEPDAFPSSDLILRRMSGNLTARALQQRSEAWRPWRAYAVILLWQAASDEHTHSRRTKNAQPPSRSRQHDRGHAADPDVAAHGPRRENHDEGRSDTTGRAERRLHPLRPALRREAIQRDSLG